MTVSDVLALCEQGQCVMLEPRSEFDACVRGVLIGNPMRVVYSLDAVASVFAARDGMDREGAIDWVVYNVEPPECKGWPVFVSDEV